MSRLWSAAKTRFGNIGAPGLMTERGFAALIWRGDQAFFVGKGFEQPAYREQVQKIRAFATDLANALRTATVASNCWPTSSCDRRAGRGAFLPVQPCSLSGSTLKTTMYGLAV